MHDSVIREFFHASASPQEIRLPVVQRVTVDVLNPFFVSDTEDDVRQREVISGKLAAFDVHTLYPTWVMTELRDPVRRAQMVCVLFIHDDNVLVDDAAATEALHTKLFRLPVAHW